MMMLIWSGFALGALVWTGSAVAVSVLLYWGAGVLASADNSTAGTTRNCSLQCKPK